MIIIVQQRIHQLLILLVLLLGLASSSTAEPEQQQEECWVGSSDGEQEVCRQATTNSEEESAERVPAQPPTLHQLVDDSDNNNQQVDCADNHTDCALWATRGECKNNPGYMLHHCQKSCQACRVETDEQRQLADATVAFGERQTIPSQNVMTVVQTMLTYMTDMVQTNETYASIRDECRNRHAQCSEWAALGECQRHPAYMRINCAPTCGTCEQLDFNVRCPFDKDAPKVFQQAGDVNRWFERLLFQAPTTLSLRPKILSAPAEALEQKKHDPQIDIAENVLQDGPWVVTIPNFLSPAECEHLIELGAKEGYERSKEVGTQTFDGTVESLVDPRRTSTNAWCMKECFNDPMTQQLTQRLEILTGIPANNFDYWQILKYEEGQEYMEHNDWKEYLLGRSEGVRILTVFLYLNTVADDGGGTRFTKLDLTVQPVVGTALIWPNTLDQQPDAKDPRTNHQAMPVLNGIKYGANVWIHQRDFKTPHGQDCA